MTMERFNELKRNKTTEQVIVDLIKQKDPSVRKLGKGKYEIVDEMGNPFIRTKGLRV